MLALLLGGGVLYLLLGAGTDKVPAVERPDADRVAASSDAVR